MNIEYLKTFTALAESKNFSQTAKDLIVAQSTISNRIKELEEEFGQKLFIRNNKSCTLTSAGETLLEYAEQIINIQQKAIEQVNLSGRFTERLVVGTVYAFYDCFLFQTIQDFTKHHPEISLRIEFGHSYKNITSLQKNSADIVFSHHPYHHPDYICNLIKEDDLILVTSFQNAEYSSGISYELIKDLPVIYSNFLYENTHDWLFSKHRQFQLEVEIGSKIIPFLKESRYYSFLSRKLVEKELKNNILREVHITDGELPPVQYYIIYKKEKLKKEAVTKWLPFIESIK